MRILTCKTGSRVRGMGLMGRWTERAAKLSSLRLEVVSSRLFHIKASVDSLCKHLALSICNDNSTRYTYLQTDVLSEIPTEHHKAVCLPALTKSSQGPTSWCSQGKVEVWRWKTRHTSSFFDTEWKWSKEAAGSESYYKRWQRSWHPLKITYCLPGYPCIVQR